jgi:hypothetical protein
VRLNNPKLSKLFCPKLMLAKTGNQVRAHPNHRLGIAAPAQCRLSHKQTSPERLQIAKL